MTSNSIRTQCPNCAANTSHAFVPSVSQPTLLTSDADSLGLKANHRFVCTACERAWEAAVIPQPQLELLRAAVSGLDEARRQIAMMRLIMSKDQLDRAEKSTTEVLRIHRAA